MAWSGAHSLSPEASSLVVLSHLDLGCLLSPLVCLSSIKIPLQWMVSSWRDRPWKGVFVGQFPSCLEASLHYPHQPPCRSLVVSCSREERNSATVSGLDGSACFLPREYLLVVEGSPPPPGYLIRCLRCFPLHSAAQKLMPLWLMVCPYLLLNHPALHYL